MNIGRVGALAVAVGIGISMPFPTASAAAPQRTALVLGGTTVPTPDSVYIDAVRDHFVGPLLGSDITYVPVTTPMELWPITGAARVVWFFFGPSSVWGFGGPAWPDEPLWKLSGLFDLTFDESVASGVSILGSQISARPGEPLVVFGYSQGAMVADQVKRNLANQYPNGDGPDIEFVLVGDPEVPNGGLAARFPGLYIPILNFTFPGAAPTDTQFHTVEDINQYDGLTDFPLYPLNLISTGNALLGVVYRHPRDLEPSVDDPGTIHTTFGDTDYYFHPTDDLPLFDPLRGAGAPEPLIDVVEPVVKQVVEQGYDRSIPLGQPTPARLIPQHDPAQVVTDFGDAVKESVHNAAALLHPPMSDGFKFSPTKLGNSPTAGKTPIRDAVRQVRGGLRAAVHKVGSDVHAALTPKSKPDSNEES